MGKALSIRVLIIVGAVLLVVGAGYLPWFSEETGDATGTESEVEALVEEAEPLLEEGEVLEGGAQESTEGEDEAVVEETPEADSEEWTLTEE